MKARRELAILTTAILLAASSPAMAQTWSLTLTSDRRIETSDLKADEPNTVTGTAARVQFTCQTASDCAEIGLRLQKPDGTAVPPTLGRSPADSNNFLVPSGPLQGTSLGLAVLFDGNPIATFPVTAAAAAPDVDVNGNGGENGNADAPSLAEMLTTRCDPQIPPEAKTLHYNAEENEGEILIMPTGVVLARAVETFDENDTLQVTVYGDARLFPLLNIQRTSAFRDVQTVRIVGAGETVPESLITREATGVCQTWKVPVSDFAPGQGKVQVSALQGIEWVPLGSFDLNVDPLYTGMFSLGAAWSDAVDPEYKLASNGTETVIALGDEGENDLLYPLFYTPFVWGKRDLEKRIPKSRFWERINPSFGIVPEDIGDNALVGITIDLPAGLVFTYGWHFRRVTVLPEDTGLEVGSPFSGTADQLPTAKSWEDATFFAVTVDLRAMVQLFTAAVGGGSGGS